jgi:regulator of PEP synthase PpsR (kinase-PPPase family)
MKLHLHLLSDSTGETLENIAKAALAQFDDVEVLRHFWPMVRSETHLERILAEIAQNPGLVIFTLVNPEIRRQLETRCRAIGLPAVAPLDPCAVQSAGAGDEGAAGAAAYARCRLFRSGRCDPVHHCA